MIKFKPLVKDHKILLSGLLASLSVFIGGLFLSEFSSWPDSGTSKLLGGVVMLISPFPVLLALSYLKNLKKTIVISLTSVIWSPLLTFLLLVSEWTISSSNRDGGGSMYPVIIIIVVFASIAVIPNLIMVLGLAADKIKDYTASEAS